MISALSNKGVRDPCGLNENSLNNNGQGESSSSCSKGAQLAGWSPVLASAPTPGYSSDLKACVLQRALNSMTAPKVQGQFCVLRLRALMMPETFEMAAKSLGGSSAVTFHGPLHRFPEFLLSVGEGRFTLLAGLRFVAKDVLEAVRRRLPLETRKLRRGEHQLLAPRTRL